MSLLITSAIIFSLIQIRKISKKIGKKKKGTSFWVSFLHGGLFFVAFGLGITLFILNLILTDEKNEHGKKSKYWNV